MKPLYQLSIQAQTTVLKQDNLYADMAYDSCTAVDYLYSLMALKHHNWLDGLNILQSWIDELGSLKHKEVLPPPFLAALLWQYYEDAPSFYKKKNLLQLYFQPLLSYQLQLYKQFDTYDNGLIAHQAACIDPFFQSLLIWSNEALIKMGQVLGQDMIELIQYNELSIYSCTEELWDAQRFEFCAIYKQKTISLQEQASRYLPLFTHLLTQEEAELLVGRLLQQGFPLQSNQTNKTAELNKAEAYCLYLGLLAYDMEEAAEYLQEYTGCGFEV